jgi:PD-(D/E)XK endonuclease
MTRFKITAAAVVKKSRCSLIGRVLFMPETSSTGNLTEAKVVAALIEVGYLVSLPFGSGHKYDLIADDGQNLFRVQCKTGRVRNGALIFNAYSMPGNKAKKCGYKGLADLFAVLNPMDGKVFLVPVEEVGTSDVHLRLSPTGNSQAQGIRWAAKYELRPISGLCASSSMVEHWLPKPRVAGSIPVSRSNS